VIKIGLALAVIAAAAVLAFFLFHHHAEPASERNSLVTVAAAPVTRGEIFNEEEIPGEFRAYVEVELHAKVSGYVDQMNVDFGDRVKAGQLLATLEVPELHDELNNARAVFLRTEADYTNAHLIYTRLVGVNRQNPNLVAPQEVDTALAKDDSAAAALAGAKADVGKYETLVKYTQITAPFDGIITKRYADPGALIQAATSSDTQSMPLVRLSDNFRLRMDFPVSVKYVKDVRLGKPVQVKVESLGGKIYDGKITRFTQQVNDETRTMMTEIEVPNPELEIIPGMYASVIWRVEERPNALMVPIQAVGGGHETSVYIIGADHQIEMRPVVLGLESPDHCEIVSGVKEGELVMIGGRSIVQPGQKVDVKVIDRLAPN